MLFGAVALVFGTLSALLGDAIVPDTGSVSPNIDSELRFFSVWYAAAGLIALRASRRVASEGRVIRGVFAVLFLGGCARLIGLIAVGTPHPVFVTLMVVELALPVLVIPWQAAVARR